MTGIILSALPASLLRASSQLAACWLAAGGAVAMHCCMYCRVRHFCSEATCRCFCACLSAARAKVKVAVPYPVSPHVLRVSRRSCIHDHVAALSSLTVTAKITHQLTVSEIPTLQKGVDHSKVEAVVPFKNVELKVRSDIGWQHWMLFSSRYRCNISGEDASRHHARLLLVLTPLLIRPDLSW